MEAPGQMQRIEAPNFQDFDEWMKEQNALDAQCALGGNGSAPPAKKKNMPAIDVDIMAAEAQAREELGEVNWIGRLVEYRQAHPSSIGGLESVESVEATVGIRHTCTVIISESAQHFGGNNITFSSKKAAKQFASKKAIDWLVENGHMPADGSVRFPKAKAMTVQPVASQAGQAKTSIAGQIPGLCIRLGFCPPRYEIERVSESAPLYSGYAHFGGDPRIHGKIGEVQIVFGKKNVKERIAEEVLSFLHGIERQRGEVEEGDKKRKRLSVSLEAEDMKNSNKQKMDGGLSSSC